MLVVVGLFSLSGSSCPRAFTWTTPAPRVLPPNPTPEQVVQAVNQHSSQIQSFSSNSATLSGTGFPPIGANLAFQRPNFFRLRAGTGLLGAEVDLGSNDQLFWFWVKRNQPPGVYFCRHDQYAGSRARQMMPIEPQWLIEALGVARFDPNLPHQGPFPVAGGRLQMRTIRETPQGSITKVTVVDAASALVMEQQVLDPRGQLLASAVTEGYRRDAYSGLFMPQSVRINSPPNQFSMKLSLGNLEVNRLAGNPGELWAMPSYPGSQPVDLCSPSFAPPAAPAQVGMQPPSEGLRRPSVYDRSGRQ
jgi:hypothetical protein